MVNVKKMQRNIDKLLSVFTNLIDALNDSINQLKSGITHNKSTITALEAENATYVSKIAEYEVLRDSIRGVLGGVNKEVAND